MPAAISRLRNVPGWSRLATLPPHPYMWAVERLTGAREGGAAGLPGPSEGARRRLAESLAEDAARFRELTGEAIPSWSV